MIDRLSRVNLEEHWLGELKVVVFNHVTRPSRLGDLSKLFDFVSLILEMI